ncbi:hypothetical protein TWF694_002134, partial [Orbilia ellipsospora]
RENAPGQAKTLKNVDGLLFLFKFPFGFPHQRRQVAAVVVRLTHDHQVPLRIRSPSFPTKHPFVCRPVSPSQVRSSQFSAVDAGGRSFPVLVLFLALSLRSFFLPRGRNVQGTDFNGYKRPWLLFLNFFRNFISPIND